MNKIVKVVIVADFGYVEGGAAKVALDSLCLLHKTGHEVILFCGSAKVDSAIESLGCRIVKLGMPQLKDHPDKLRAMVDGLWNRTAADRLARLLSELSPEETVVHVHSWTKILSPSIFSVLRKSGFRTVMTAHDYFLICPNGAFYDYVHQCLCPYHGGSVRCLLCNCDARSYLQKVWRWIRQRIVTYQTRRFPQMALLTISDLNDRILKREMPGKRAFVRVNNPMAVSKDNANSIEGKSDFLFVGRASPEKGLDLFVRAVTECGVHGVVVGDGEVLPDLRRRYPNVEYLGWVNSERVRGIIRSRAACFVFPSRLYEGSPLTPLEMMSEGVPCILSDSSAAAEYVKDGESGLLFKSGDINDLKKKICQMSDLAYRNAMSDCVRENFDASQWGEERHLEKLREIFSHIE